MRRLITIVLFVLTMIPCHGQDKALYKDKDARPQDRVEDLLKRMTLEEKVQQLRCIWMDRSVLYNGKELDFNKFQEHFKDGLGQWGRMSEDKSSRMGGLYSTEEAVKLYNQVQKWFMENTRLGIPVLVHEEGLHGHISTGATHFPMPIGLASSWDEALMTEVYTTVAREIRAKGGHEVLAPVVDIVRDPRWGRTEETMGEDPYLNGRLGIAQVKAFQGNTGPDGEIGPGHVGATLKHFGVHGQSEGGSNTAPSFVDELYTLETFLRPFKMCFEEAHPHYVMVSYNETWGVPAHANRHLVTDILRDKLGFDGLVVSDYGGVGNALELNLTDSHKEAAWMAFHAGVESDLPEGNYYGTLVELVKEGRVDEAEIDRAVRHILLEKFRMGLFDNPYLDMEASKASIATPQARQLAYKAATESMVLLQNRDGVLPFDASKIKTIAVIGPTADVVRLGGYSGQPSHPVSVLDAVKAKYGKTHKILYAEGCKLTVKPELPEGQMVEVEGFMIPSAVAANFMDMSVPAPDSVNKPLVEEAVEVARQADAIILCLGSSESIAKEGVAAFMPGDTPSLELFGMQNELAERIAELGKPTCALIITGTPNNIKRVADAVPGILQCWYLGEEGGNAMVDAVFGAVNPSGKLTISIPRGGDHVPAYYAYKRGSRRGYTLGQDISPLYPFGFGLSYTTFQYDNLRLSRSSMSAEESVNALIDITNTGSRAGDEIVQLYIRDDISSVSRPVKELRGFERVHLEPGETKTVSLPIDRTSLEFYDANLEMVVESGSFTIMVGPSSSETQSVSLQVTK